MNKAVQENKKSAVIIATEAGHSEKVKDYLSENESTTLQTQHLFSLRHSSLKNQNSFTAIHKNNIPQRHTALKNFPTFVLPPCVTNLKQNILYGLYEQGILTEEHQKPDDEVIVSEREIKLCLCNCPRGNQ